MSPRIRPNANPSRTGAKRIAIGLSGLLTLGFGTFFPSTTRASEPFSPEKLEFFEQKIRPVLAEKCYDCHGSEAKKVKGGLLLDSREGWIKGGDTGPALVPGAPEKSLAISAIHYTDEELLMPPKKTGGKLPESVIKDFEKWILDGAAWPTEKKSTKQLARFDLRERMQTHWCWKLPQLAPIPQTKDTAWPKSDIDRFILAKLEAQSLAPAPAAEPSVWLRRVCFGLTGLPPSVDQTRAFLADPSPTAREKVVDQLLASPHFGERWARHWMDLVRYAEGRGHEFDYTIPNAWQYRDYLIRAFNADLSYPDLVREHIAGDLIAPRLRPGTEINESILATGFWFLGEEVHSPVDIRQDEADRIDNRLDVLSKTFLGVTVTCARCHDHKFDAISQRDYSALAGFLISSSNRQVRFETIESERKIAHALAQISADAQAPLSKALPPIFEPALQNTAETLLELRRLILSNSPIPKPLVHWKNECDKAKTLPNHPLHLFSKIGLDSRLADPGAFHTAARDALKSRSKVTPALEESIRVVADYRTPGKTPWLQDGFSFGTGPTLAGAIQLNGSPESPALSVQQNGAAQRHPLWKAISAVGETEPGGLKDFARSGQTLRTPETTLSSGNLWYLVRGPGKSYACVDSHLMIGGPLHGKLLFRWKDSGSWQWVNHNLTDYKNHRLHLELVPEGNQDLQIAMVVESSTKPALPFLDHPADVALLDLLTQDSISAENFAQAIERSLLQANEAIRHQALGKNAVHAAWADWIIQNPELFIARNPEMLTAFRNAIAPWLAKSNKASASFQAASQIAPAMFDGTGADDFLLRRGSTRSPLTPVPRRFLEAIAGNAPLPPGVGSGRLALAEHVLASNNPLTQRVIVNRVWHHLFGRGIVPTVDNFGVLGQPPSHPELLDHLALHFAGEWKGSLKKLIRELVLTRTYAMTSNPQSDAFENTDPENILLHRMNLRRLEAESIRDSILAISGRLEPKLGGSSVPLFLTPFMEGRGRPPSGPLDGNGRRSVYISVKRNFLSPMMLAFDMPIPFQPVGRRNVSNVPAQSLVLMNDPFVVEQASRLAQSLSKGSSAEERIRSIYLRSFAREPRPEELSDALAFVSDNSSPNEEAVWTDLCHVLFNTKEFIHIH